MGNRRSASIVLVVLLSVLTLAALPLAAQTVTGTLQGTVTDSSGSALPGVTVTIRNSETGLERVVVTDERGFFNAPFLPVGRYSLNAELAGLGTQRRTNVPVNLNETTKQEVIIDPQMTESITVNAEAPRINVSDGEIKQTMRSEEIMALPSPDQGSFLRLASVFGGYQENPSSGQDNPTLSSGSSVNFNGAGTRGTTFQINGVNNDDSSENQHRQGVALATIKSFQILTNNFSSEFGRGYGAVVLVQTKSGTNDVDGELYGYGTNSSYSSRDALTVSLSHGDRHRYQYGFTAGFPILRDKLFAFVNSDRVELEGRSAITRGVFLPADLSLPRLTLNNDTPANRAFQDSVLARFPNQAPNAPAIASRAYQTFFGINWPDEDDSVRLDYNVTTNNNLNARYQKSHQIRQSEDIVIGDNAEQDNRQSNVGLTWTGVLSSDTVQEARLGIGLRSTNANIGTGNDTPIIRFNGTGVPTFAIIGNAGAFPINRNQRDNQFVYNISSARWASNTLKIGLDVRDSQLNDVADNFSRGFWSFSAACGGVTYPSSIHAFMAGCVSSYTKGYGPFDLKNSISEQNLYAQDDWRPTDNLTLNIGVRYERVGAPQEEDDKIDYQYSDTTYVDPRLGFAYAPNWASNRWLRGVTGGNGRFSIRGGFGIFHGRVFQSIFSQGGANVRFNPPNAANLGLSGVFPAPYSNFNLADPTNGYVFTPGVVPVGASLTIIDPDLQMPESRQWNLTFERQIFSQSRLRVSYVGTFGKDLLQYDRDNLPLAPDQPGSKYVVAADWRCAGTGTPGVPIAPATCPVAVPIADNEISLRVPRTAARRPDPNGGTHLVVRNQAESWYHAGQLEWETGLWRGLQGRSTYTFSKAIDTGSEATITGIGDTNIPIDDDRFKRGLSRFDTRHRFTISGSYALPFFRDRRDLLGSVLGGWTLSTVLRLASGTPFTITDSRAQDVNFDGVSDQRPVCTDPQFCSGWSITHPSEQNQIPASAFRPPVYGETYGDLVGRNSFFKDGAESTDFGLHKAFALPFADTSLALRMDCFNCFNTVTWGFPTTDVASPNFLRVNTTLYSPRSLQFGLRLIY